jgi:hypothetical protein
MGINVGAGHTDAALLAEVLESGAGARIGDVNSVRLNMGATVMALSGSAIGVSCCIKA